MTPTHEKVTEAPMLSVIIPIYNVEHYLRECLDSVYSLSDINYEVILVNDGSPDGSPVIIDEYRRRYSENTTVVNKENGGLSSARNAGLSEAKGRYVSFVDSDDYIDANALRDVVLAVAKDDLDFGSAQAKAFWDNETRGFRELSMPPQVNALGQQTGAQLIELLHRSKFKRNECWTKVVKRSFLMENSISFIESILYEDVVWNFKLHFLATRARVFNQVTYFYRQRPNSIMSSKVDAKDISRLVIARELDRLIQNYAGGASMLNDYIVSQLWEHSRFSTIKDNRLVMRLLFMRKVSVRERLRLIIILLGLPRLFD